VSLVNVCVYLRAGGVSVLLDVTGGRLPAVAHWGADLGDLGADEVRDVLRAARATVGNNEVDEPVRVALLPEHWTGWTGRPGLSGSRQGRDWSPKFSTTALRLDETDVAAQAADLTLVSTGPGRVQVDATDAVAQLAMTITVELEPSGLLRVQARLTNTSDEVYQVEDCVLALPVPQVGREILDLAGRWGKERMPQRRELTVGTHLREGRRGRTGPDAATVLHVGVPGFGFAEGEVWAVHAGWSGNHTHYAERVFTGEQLIGGGELLLPGEVQLGRGDTYTTPWLYGSYGEGLDVVARRFHNYLRARPSHPGPDRPVTLNVWEAVYFDHDLDRLLDLAERAAALGVERYVLDDGWFGSRRNDLAGLGDWTVARDVWPDGLHPLVNRVRELGMEFGLWFEPEMVNLDSDVARAHPDWVMATGGRLPVESRHQQVINLGIPECYTHIRDAILAILDEYDIGYIKWDHNRDLIDAGTQPSGRPGVHEQTLAFYRLVDEIKAAHPGLEIESCSSGGARVDLGVLERTERVWVSDCIDPLDREQMHRWTTQLIPPEMMGAHIASGRSHTTGRIHDLGFRAATAIFGHLGIEWDLARANEEELEELRSWVGYFKQHRALLLGGDLVRIDFPDLAWSGHGVVAKDGSEGIFSFVSLGRSDVSSLGRLRLPGLDPDRRYHVKPVLNGPAPRGLQPPAWWGLRPAEHSPYTDLSHHQSRHLESDGGPSGVTLSGAVLAKVGLMSAVTDPDQALIYHLVAVDD
jgi:alpha-galactosidase